MPSDAAETIAAKVLLAVGCDLESISRKNGDTALKVLVDFAAEGPAAEMVSRLVNAELRAHRSHSPDSAANWLSHSVRKRISSDEMLIGTYVSEPTLANLSV